MFGLMIWWNCLMLQLGLINQLHLQYSLQHQSGGLNSTAHALFTIWPKIYKHLNIIPTCGL